MRWHKRGEEGEEKKEEGVQTEKQNEEQDLVAVVPSQTDLWVFPRDQTTPSPFPPRANQGPFLAFFGRYWDWVEQELGGIQGRSMKKETEMSGEKAQLEEKEEPRIQGEGKSSCTKGGGGRQSYLASQESENFQKKSQKQSGGKGGMGAWKGQELSRRGWGGTPWVRGGDQRGNGQDRSP